MEKSSLDTLLERSKINFPRPLDSPHASELLNYISNKLPGTVTYTISAFISLGQHVEKQLGTVRIEGNIRSDEGFSSTSFSTLSSKADSSYISGILFNSIPGYSINEHRKQEVDLWDRIRTLVNDYFEA